MKCRAQSNGVSTCLLAVKTDQFKFWPFSVNLTINVNHTIWMVNRSDVNEKETPNCLKTGNARVAQISRVLGGFQIVPSLPTTLLCSVNRSFGKTIWKINTWTPGASKGRHSKLHKYQLCSLGKVCYKFENKFALSRYINIINMVKITIKSVWLRFNSQFHALQPKLFTASEQVEILLFCTQHFIGWRKRVGIYCFRSVLWLVKFVWVTPVTVVLL